MIESHGYGTAQLVANGVWYILFRKEVRISERFSSKGVKMETFWCLNKFSKARVYCLRHRGNVHFCFECLCSSLTVLKLDDSKKKKKKCDLIEKNYFVDRQMQVWILM